MKSYCLKILLILQSIVVFAGKTSPVEAQESEATLQVFYDELSPYGDWIQDDNYGFVWIPDAGSDFHPYYSNGYWEMTVYGNMWVSLYPWGWAAFHYGRWTYDPFYGWVWIPGYQWAPAWVCWRYGGGFYGWAPIGPLFIISGGFWNYGCPDNWWIFTPDHCVYGPRQSAHYRLNTGREHIRASVIINRTGTDQATNTIYPLGPSADDIKKSTGEEVTVRETYQVSSPALSTPTTTAVRLYRPQIERSETMPATQPAKFEKAPRPVKENQPAEPQRGATPAYKEFIRQSPHHPFRQPAETVPAPPVRQQPLPNHPTERPASWPREGTRNSAPQRTQPAQQGVQPQRQTPRNVPRQNSPSPRLNTVKPDRRK